MHNEEYSESIILGWVPYTYRAAQTYTTHWNQAPFSPAMPEESVLMDWAFRAADTLTFLPPMYGDRDGHGGFIGSTSSARLYRDGELVGEYAGSFGGPATFDVPPEPATYRLEVDHAQSMFELTPHQQVAWTFESGHVEEGGSARLPLLVVRFTPELDEHGRAPSGTRFCLPFSVDQFDRVVPPEVSTPTLEVSFDDGATWGALAVESDADRYKAFVDQPKHAKYVSLRASTHDAEGNAVEQTLYRAYGLAEPH
jgi:hypothetical protein